MHTLCSNNSPLNVVNVTLMRVNVAKTLVNAYIIN